jgi:ornithine decarboxylase
LDLYLPESMDVRIIAEPGRYYVASAFSLAVSVIARRQISKADTNPDADENEPCGDDEPMFMYYVNDGVYGSFNCILFDHAIVEPTLPVPERYVDEPQFTCSLWGPTCDGLDCIIKECQLPKLDTGDWLVFKDMGAYTMSAASCFNGMPKSKCYYVMQEYYWAHLSNSGSINLPLDLTHHLPPMKTGLDASENDVPTLPECLPLEI